jgi:hypothetical protein
LGRFGTPIVSFVWIGGHCGRSGDSIFGLHHTIVMLRCSPTPAKAIGGTVRGCNLWGDCNVFFCKLTHKTNQLFKVHIFPYAPLRPAVEALLWL